MTRGRALLGRVRVAVRQALCGLTGHERYLHTDAGLVTLRCVLCGHDTPGWTTGQRAYQRTQDGDAARHRLPPPAKVIEITTRRGMTRRRKMAP